MFRNVLKITTAAMVGIGIIFIAKGFIFGPERHIAAGFGLAAIGGMLLGLLYVKRAI